MLNIQSPLNEETRDALVDLVEVSGFELETDPDQADFMGAFEESALTEEEAKESAVDLEDVGSFE